MCFVTTSFVTTMSIEKSFNIKYLTFEKHLVTFKGSGQTNTEWC